MVRDISESMDFVTLENVKSTDQSSLWLKELEQAFHLIDFTEKRENHLEQLLEKGRSKSNGVTEIAISLKAKLLEIT